MTLVRLITFRSAILRQVGQDLVLHASVKKAFAFSSLRFSNGSTAMLFSRHSGRSARRVAPFRKIEERSRDQSGDEEKRNDDFIPRHSLRFNNWRGHRTLARQPGETSPALPDCPCLRVEIHQAETHAVFHLAFAEIMQARRPLPILHQIIGHMLGEEDVPGIAAIHHPLRHVDPAPAMLVRPLTSVTSLTGPL